MLCLILTLSRTTESHVLQSALRLRLSRDSLEFYSSCVVKSVKSEKKFDFESMHYLNRINKSLPIFLSTFTYKKSTINNLTHTNLTLLNDLVFPELPPKIVSKLQLKLFEYSKTYLSGFKRYSFWQVSFHILKQGISCRSSQFTILNKRKVGSLFILYSMFLVNVH